MGTVLGITPLGIPPPPPHVVARPRLVHALERAIDACRIVLLSAPAGYGKTTALASWARQVSTPVAWLTLDPGVDDPERFLRSLLKAWEHAQPGVADLPAGMLLSGMMPALETVIPAFIDTAARSSAPVMFVLDDYHAITDPAIHHVMTTLVETLPSTARFVVGSRERPPLPVARWRARQQLAELGPDDLRLRPDEAEAFLNDQLGLELAEASVVALNEQVEGWFAGIQLASLTIAHGTDPPAAISGRHRFIADFVREDVLSRLVPETAAFLMRTSIVPEVCAPLAEAITGSVGAQAMLERLERDNLFTQPLDDNREWFRYHRLFADVLRDELGRQYPDDVARLHRRAAEWFLHRDMADPAFDHAVAAGDLGLTFDVVNRFGLVKLHTGHLLGLQRWLRALPASWFEREPQLSLLQVAVMMYSGRFEAAMTLLADIERLVATRGETEGQLFGRMTAVKCFIACEANDTEQAEQLASVALQALPEGDRDFRGGVWGALGDVCRRNGRWREAHDHYLRALPYTDTPAGYVQSVGAYGALADLELRQGHLRKAAAYWQRARAAIADEQLWGAHPLPLVGWVYARHGEILYEWNDLAAAQHASDAARPRAELGGDPRSVIASGLLATRLHLARGEHDAAEADLARTRAVATDAPFPEWRAELERCQVELWLAQGRLRDAVVWSDQALGRDANALPDQEPVTLAIARVLITKGDPPARDHAVRLLDPLIAVSETDGRAGLCIAALALRTLALWARGDSAGALAALAPALSLAEPDGYVRSFIDLGLPMARVLQEAAARGVLPEYTGSLLAAFGEAARAPGRIGASLPEPLSAREVDVLRLLSAGLTNREIGVSLYISAETVKKHTGSIYAKLGVRGRTEAIARCRELGLLA